MDVEVQSQLAPFYKIREELKLYYMNLRIVRDLGLCDLIQQVSVSAKNKNVKKNNLIIRIEDSRINYIKVIIKAYHNMFTLINKKHTLYNMKGTSTECYSSDEE